MDLLLRNIGLLVTPQGNAAQSGAAQGAVERVENAAVGIAGGRIAYVGPEQDAPKASQTHDCAGRLVTPGLVDAHTHLVFGGWRQHEMALKRKDVPYLEILRQGGGILNTVSATRAASEEQLFDRCLGFAREMLQHGTTTVECKSGYGLALDDELKQLRVIRRLQASGVQGFVPTFMGAHAIPPEYKHDRDAYIRLITDVMLPRIAEEGLATFCDVFCETAVFTPDETKRILRAAQQRGLRAKMHADEIDCIGGAETAAEIGCISAEHLIQASDEGIRRMAEANVIAVLLPATSFYLDKPYARARHMIEAGVPVAVATDFNPGSSPNLNLQVALCLACLRYKLTSEEALCAATLNAAAAIDRANEVGSVEIGKAADLVIWDAPDLDYLFYRYGSNLVHTVVKRGAVYKTVQ